MTTDKLVSKLDAGTKKSWKMHQTADELHKWSAYLQLSAERFIEEFTAHSSRLTSSSPMEAKVLREALDRLETLKKESGLLKVQARRLHGHRRS